MYCDPADLYSYGLPRGGLPNPGRLAGSADVSADTFTLGVHGFADDDELTFRVDTGGSLPSPLVAGTTYYAVVTSESVFQVAASAGGAAIDLTTAGAGVIVSTPLPITACITWASRMVDDMLVGHAVPLSAPYPTIVRAVTAELAAGRLLALAGAKSVSLGEIEKYAQAKLAKWQKGIPIRGTNAPDGANLAASAMVPFDDARGWSTHGGL